jgi:hypothetical protein
LNDLVSRRDVRRGKALVGNPKAWIAAMSFAPLASGTNEDVEVAGEARPAAKARAYAPTITNSTSWSFSNPQNALKSGARSIDLIALKLDGREPFFR